MERRMDRGWSKNEYKWVYGTYTEIFKRGEVCTTWNINGFFRYV